MSQRKKTLRHAQRALPRSSSSANSGVMLPLGAMLLAGSLNAMAQTAPAAAEKTLPTVVVREQSEAPEGKDALRATETRIGKGQQQLRRQDRIQGFSRRLSR